MPKRTIEITIENIKKQLRQYDILLKNQYLKTLTDTLLNNSLFQEIAGQPPKVKLKRSKNKGEQAIIVDENNSELLRTDFFPFSILHHEGELYLLLSKKCYREDTYISFDTPDRGHRYGTLAIHLTGDYELFFVKMIEYDTRFLSKNTHLLDECESEMAISKQFMGGIHDKPLYRNTGYSTKVYIFTPFKGFESLLLLQENRLNPSQILYLSVQYMLKVFTVLAEKHVVHRDLKVENYTARILENGLLDVSIIDFGFARQMKLDTRTGEYYYLSGNMANIGTPAYAPASLKYNIGYRYYNIATDLFSAAKSAATVLNHLLFQINQSSIRLDDWQTEILKKINHLIASVLNNNTFNATNKSYAVVDASEIKTTLISFEEEIRILIIGHDAKPMDVEDSLSDSHSSIKISTNAGNTTPLTDAEMMTPKTEPDSGRETPSTPRGLSGLLSTPVAFSLFRKDAKVACELLPGSPMDLVINTSP